MNIEREYQVSTPADLAVEPLFTTSLALSHVLDPHEITLLHFIHEVTKFDTDQILQRNIIEYRRK